MNWLPDKLVNHLRHVADLPDLSGTKYGLLRKLASGGMGTVYLVRDTQLDRDVALKVLTLPDASGEMTARMLREAKIVARLEHPGIVPIHDAGTLSDSRVFYVMKLVQGDGLDQYLSKSNSLPDVLRVFQKACEAVAFAHAHQVIHRDLKPENIMVGAFGEVLVMDWGLAKILAESRERSAEGEGLRAKGEEREAKAENGKLTIEVRGSRIENPKSKIPNHETLHGTVMGTPAYMAPEQKRGEIDQIDQRTDVYALGAILKFLLQGRTVSGDAIIPTDARRYSAQLSDAPPRWNKIPKALAAIGAKAMAAEKAQRYASALDLAADIERFLNGLAVSSYKESVFEVAWRRIKQYRFIILLVLVYLLVRLVLIFWFRP